MEAFGDEMLPDNPSFDVSEQILQFICERSECTDAPDELDKPMDPTAIIVVSILGGILMLAALACCLKKKNTTQDDGAMYDEMDKDGM